MEALRLADVTACLVAWHNRHPLARRIGASHVHAIGYVALPFDGGGAVVAAPADAAPAADEGGTLRERAEKRAKQAQEPPVIVELALDRKTLQPAFSEDFIDPLPQRAVARFAQAHAQALARAPADGPLRAVRADRDAPLTLYLLTAVVETGTRKSRVLIGGGAKPQVLGRRVLSTPRLALALVPLVLLAAAGLALAPGETASVLRAAAPPASAPAVPPPRVAVAASTPPASAATVAAAASGSAPEPASAAEPAAAAAVAAAPPPRAASAPIDVEPQLGRIVMPSIKPQFSARRAAAEAAAAAAAPASSAPLTPPMPVAAASAPAPRAAPPVSPPAGQFALSTRLLRTRAEADQTRVAMRSLLTVVAARDVHVDVLPAGDDWRVVGLPFSDRASAEKARALLVSRGMKVQVVGF